MSRQDIRTVLFNYSKLEEHLQKAKEVGVTAFVCSTPDQLRGKAPAEIEDKGILYLRGEQTVTDQLVEQFTIDPAQINSYRDLRERQHKTHTP